MGSTSEAMKRKRFSVEQVVAILKQAEVGTPVAALIRKVGITEQTFYRWKKRYQGMESDQVRALKLKQLQEENIRLKRVVADLTLDKVLLQDVLAKKFWSPRGNGRWSRISVSGMESAHDGRVGRSD